MADKKLLSGKEIDKRIMDLKIELLKQPLKRKSIKREIARLLTMNTLTKQKEEKSSGTPRGIKETK